MRLLLKLDFRRPFQRVRGALSFVPAGLVILVASALFGRFVKQRGAKNALILASLIVVFSFVFFIIFNATLVEIVIGTMILFAFEFKSDDV